MQLKYIPISIFLLTGCFILQLQIIICHNVKAVRPHAVAAHRSGGESCGLFVSGRYCALAQTSNKLCLLKYVN